MEEMNDEVNRRITTYKYQAERYYNKRVKLRTFLPDNLVCRKLKAARLSEAQGALAPKWKEPIQVSQALGNGAYKLKTFYGELVPRNWNTNNLQKYYE